MEKNTNLSGFLLINKPSGPTSHDIIDQLRKITGIAKIGHAGTLDPFASGLLICAVGRATTKKLSVLVKLDKEYEAVFYLGAATDTYDHSGKITSRYQGRPLEPATVSQVLAEFVGAQNQIPPMFSAKKVGGHKLYDLARAGQTVERQPAAITIYNLELLNYAWPHLCLRINCSSGTYIRSLAFDLGERLGCGAYVEELQRTAIGKYNLESAVNLEQLSRDNWQRYLAQLVTRNV